VFQWRDQLARQQERSPRRIIPDDLVVEIAKRGDGDIQKLKAIRGLTQRINERYLPDIAAQIQMALREPEHQLPEKSVSPPTVSLGLLGQFLATGLGLMCVQQQLAPSLVATAQDIRDLAAWKLGLLRSEETPYLLKGWRRQVIGDVMDDIIAGKLALRIADPKSNSPVRLERWPGN
jgi:ribonuclease D